MIGRKKREPAVPLAPVVDPADWGPDELRGREDWIYALGEPELAELDRAEDGRRGEELGDLLFTVVNYARRIGVDPDAALRDANARFERRFRAVEQMAAADGPAHAHSLEQLEAFWQRAKRDEAGAAPGDERATGETG